MQTKIIIAVVLLTLGGGFVWHYKSLVAERNQLRADVVIFEANEKILKQSIEDERTAAAQAITDRAATQRSLDRLREGRENDVEAQEWAAILIPPGERQRLCEALPQADGCQSE